ncbi:unnamed protein product [Alopecurus aequalis]
MSWSLGASSAPGFHRATGRRGVESRSPVPYRENPMAYEPEKKCRCDPPRKAPRWISWSRQNPGRRYYACVDAVHGGCGDVEWHDGELPKKFSDLIGDLKDEVWRLRGLVAAARAEEECPMVAMGAHEQAPSNAVMTMQAQLMEKNAELEAMKGKYMNVVMFFCVFVLGLVLGKMIVY